MHTKTSDFHMHFWVFYTLIQFVLYLETVQNSTLQNYINSFVNIQLFVQFFNMILVMFPQ